MINAGLLGIDIGGTSIKAVICNDKGGIIRQANAPTFPAYSGKEQHTDTGAQRIIDSTVLWEITRNVIRDVLKQIPLNYKVYSVAVSSVGCTMLAVDERDNQIPIYADIHSLKQEYGKLSSAFTQEEYMELTGYPLENSLSGLHLVGCGADKKSISKIFSVDDFIVYKLTGLFSRNYSTAASNGMWNVKKGEWINFLKQGSGLSDHCLGKPGNSGVFVGTISRKASDETGLSTEVKVSTGGMDYQCAAFSIQNIIKDNLLNVTGTIDLLACYEDIPDSFPEKKRYIQDYHVIPGIRNIMVETVGSAQTEWLKNNIVAQDRYGFSLNWDRFFDGLKDHYQKHLIHGEIYIPQVLGSYFPLSDTNISGVFGGLNGNTDSLVLLRTMLEGMAYQTKRMADFLSCGRLHKKVVLVGGGSKNKTWAQIKADIIGRDMILPSVKEASAVGAALLGAIGAGLYKDYSEIGSITGDNQYEYIFYNKSNHEYFCEMYQHVYLPLIDQWEQTNRTITLINERYGKWNESS